MLEHEAITACLAMRMMYPMLYDLAIAIKDFEGWEFNPPSRSFRNKNPGNLKYGYDQDRTDKDGFAIFETYHHGLFALLRDLFMKCAGQSRWVTPYSTLLELISAYAPAADGNLPENYASFVAQRIGVDTTFKIYNFIEENYG